MRRLTRGLATVPGPWAHTYTARTKAELVAAYQRWAPSYDADSVGAWGYAAPAACAAALARHVPDRDARVLDAGAGTGLVGLALAERHGFRRLCALDLSPHMLDECAAKAVRGARVYEQLVEADLEDLGALVARGGGGGGGGAFDAAVCVGTFTPNHVGADALEELCGAVRVGGVVALTARADFGRGAADAPDDALGRAFRAREAALRRQGAITLLEATAPAPYTPSAPGDSSRTLFECYVYRVEPAGLRGPLVTCA